MYNSLKIYQKTRLKVAFRWLLILFYLVAGINHFIHPQFYIPLIPPYFPYPDLINLISGAVEILLALGVLFSSTRKRAVQGIILMLIAFIPSHVYFIEIGACVGLQSLCTPIWVAWVRLLLIHPLLIVWAWSVR